MLNLPINTPAARGFRMPAEWEPHEATWLAWPHKEASWPGKISAIPPIYSEIVRHLSTCEKVRIEVCDEEMRDEARRTLEHYSAWNENVELHLIPNNDAWARDHGPIFVVKDQDGTRELGVTDWIFNSWGDKYPPTDLDNKVPGKIASMYKLEYWAPGIVLEGGSIDVNGKGTLLTTEACLLNKNRNPHLTKEEIEAYLKAYLGVRHILWLGDGIVGDDTDGHIDDLARFIDERTIVTVVEENPADENYDILQYNLGRLYGMRDQDGQPFRVVTLPMPAPVIFEDTRLPASYANFYIANKVVLVPTYQCENDPRALAILKGLFPHHKVIGVNCTDLVWGLGAIHCISQQQPRR